MDTHAKAPKHTGDLFNLRDMAANIAKELFRVFLPVTFQSSKWTILFSQASSAKTAADSKTAWEYYWQRLATVTASYLPYPAIVDVLGLSKEINAGLD